MSDSFIAAALMRATDAIANPFDVSDAARSFVECSVLENSELLAIIVDFLDSVEALAHAASISQHWLSAVAAAHRIWKAACEKRWKAPSFLCGEADAEFHKLFGRCVRA